MEIFQTIWTVLTTENEVLASILTYCFTFIEATVTMLIFTFFLNISSAKSKKILYVILFSLFSILISCFVPKPYNTFINVLICPILVIIFFKTKILTAILAEVISYIIFVISGAISLNAFILLFGLTTESVMSIPINRICCSLCIYGLAYIIYRILKHFKFHIKLLDAIKFKSNYVLYINFIIGILAICMQSYIATFYNDILPIQVVILNISSLLLYFIISIYSLFRTSKLEVTERNLELSRQYINTLTILHDSIRCFKHDFSNIVSTIGRLCSNR